MSDLIQVLQDTATRLKKIKRYESAVNIEQAISEIQSQADRIKALEERIDHLDKENDYYQKLFMMEDPYCVPELIRILTECADILLDVDGKNYQGTGWEVLDAARKQAKAWLNKQGGE